MKQISPMMKRHTAWFLITVIVAQLFAPYQAYALTGGPSQPEVQSFEPIGTSEMVDVSSGKFNYNIPLLDVGGYPMNIAYHAGAAPDDEASVCGLGWNINAGAINRNMRGIPDDFKGEAIEQSFNLEDNKTWGGSLSITAELFGLKGKKGKKPAPAQDTNPNKKKIGSLTIKLGASYNNYVGVGLEFGVTPVISAGVKGFGKLNVGLGLHASSQSGVGFSPSLSYGQKIGKYKDADVDLGLSGGAVITTRQGLKSATLGSTLGISTDKEKMADGTFRALNENESSSRTLLSPTASFSFSKPTYTPSSQMSFKNQSYTLWGAIGGELFGFFPAASLSGYFTKQSLLEKNSSRKSYGAFYLQEGATDDENLLDYNREKDGPFNGFMPHLPLTSLTHDVYAVAGQGVGGSYQIKRGDVGMVSDSRTKSIAFGGSGGVEAGLGNVTHIGADLVVNYTSTKSGAWTIDNDARSSMIFQNETPNSTFEPAYFKVAGELAVENSIDRQYFDNSGGFEPSRVELAPAGGLEIRAENKLTNRNGSTVNSGTVLRRTKRERRIQPITYLTATEAKQFGLEKDIKSYPENVFLGATPAPILREGGVRKGNHLSEINVLRSDGLRYYYGLPAYNNEQYEVSFAISSGATKSCANNLVSYTANDASSANSNGRDHYYSSEKTPGYAHSWLLTAVVSPDYVDKTQDGPTPDDLGSYTKFNYVRIHSGYRWRVPFEKNMANFNPGMNTDGADDKGNYIYGTKEVWLLHSVESKTQVAEFYYSQRHDGYGVEGAMGGIGLDTDLRKLDKIVLYSRPDRKQNGLNAIPIKSVFFEYDYQLCPNIPNNDGVSDPQNALKGKLTLTKLWFTYGESLKGKLSPYRFEYSLVGNNIAYSLKNTNRWGSFQPAAAGVSCDIVNTALSNTDFPYVPQANRAQADQYAEAYNLRQIRLPSGGRIRVHYEADDYAFVQNKAATQMVEIVATSHNLQSNGVNIVNNWLDLYNPANNDEPNNYIYFKLQEPIPGNLSSNSANSYLWYQYLSGMETENTNRLIYFKALINLGKPSEQLCEYVPGYANYESFGVAQSAEAQTMIWGT